jgi:ATP-dependent protease Clp ATPase subunit
MSKNYTIHPDNVNSVDYEVLVIGYPKEELEDLLTDLVSERGRVARSRYEDFLIAHCIANLNQFMAHITSITSSGADLDLLAVREEVVALVLKYNKDLSPENIVINKNKVLKLRTDDTTVDEEVMPLVENTFWNQSFYDKDGNYKPVSKKSTTDDSIYLKKARGAEGNSPKDPIDKIKSLDELEYKEESVWWKRFNEYVQIKKYAVADVDKILTFRYFHNSTSFETFVVSHCISNIEEIYERVDGMGISVDPAKVVAELYKLCKEVNPPLTFDRFKSLRDDEDESDMPRGGTGQSSQATQPSFGFGSARKKEKKPSFRDVPKEDLLSLGNNMKVSLVGQDAAIDELSEAIKRASVGLKDPARPIGSFLFAGRTGCGKTLATKVLADSLIPTRKNRIVIDCSEYSSDHEYAKLIGAPAGYMGHDSGGVLTNAIMEDPFSVVVFDELEKASSKVYDLLLQILDEGRLTDGKGVSVSFKDAIVIMTSNIGVKEIDEVGKTIGFGDVAVLTEAKKNKALNVALKNKFKPEFLNRIDAIVNFKDLSDDDYMKIIELELERLNSNLKANSTEYRDICLTFDKKIKEYIFDKGVDVKFGARPIKRAIEKYISNEVAGLLLETDTENLVEIKVTTVRGKVKLKPVVAKKDKNLFVGAN